MPKTKTKPEAERAQKSEGSLAKVMPRLGSKPHPSFTTAALNCFFTAAQLGSIRAAADYLHIAPSAVSRHITKLEDALGAALFERLPRGIRLSSAGEVFFFHTRESSKQIERARALIADMQGLKRGMVTVATTESIATGLLPPLIAEFWKRHPEITITLQTTRSNRAFSGVAAGEFDLAIGFDKPPDVPLRVLASAKLVIGAWLPKRHKLASAMSLKLADLIDSRLLLPDHSIRLRSLLNPQLRSLGNFEPRLLSNSTSVLEMLAAEGSGVAIFTKIGASEVAKKQFVPIEDFSRVSQTLQLCARDSGLSPSGLALANHISGPIRALSDF